VQDRRDHLPPARLLGPHRLVEPSFRKAEGSGTQRLYSFDDVVRLKVVKRLLDTGVSLQKVRLAVDELRRAGSVAGGDDADLRRDDRLRPRRRRQLLDLLRRGQGVFALAIDPVIEELKGEVTAFPTERVSAAEQVAAPAAADTPAGAANA
jgi:DNA-binding transcriptional MerR regulator